MKIEIKFDPEDIEEIARRIADKISTSIIEESLAKKPQAPPQTPTSEKIWRMPDGEWWNDKQVAEVIGVAVHTLRQWRFAGKGPTYQKIGRRVLYSRSDVQEFMNSFPKIKRRN
jgi:hypothetical protein